MAIRSNFCTYDLRRLCSQVFLDVNTAPLAKIFLDVIHLHTISHTPVYSQVLLDVNLLVNM
jgi:hypothetical protein